MNAKLESMCAGYQEQLKQTTEQINQLTGTLQMLNNKVEQLKGAIFGLQELDRQLKAPAEEKTAEGKAANGKKNGKSAKTAEAAAESKAEAGEKTEVPAAAVEAKSADAEAKVN